MFRSTLIVATALLLTGAAGEPAKPSAYRVGIQCFPVIPALRAQLNLPERQGLLVIGVVPGSPAAVAGIVRHDILIRIADKPLADPNDLVQAVETAQDGNKLKIELIRGGKPTTVELTPAKQAGSVAAPPPSAGDWQTLQKFLEGLMADHTAENVKPRMQINFVRPGMIMPLPEPLPANLSIVVSREGDRPANIAVRRDDQKWELTEKQLDKLPVDIRPYVARMLGRGPFVGNIQPNVMSSLRPGAAALNQVPSFGPRISNQAAPNTDSLEIRLDKRLDELSARLDKMLQMLEKRDDDSRPHPLAN